MAEGICSEDGCENPNYCRGLCIKHYARWRRWGDPSKTLRPVAGATCSEDGCEGLVTAWGWCIKHYTRWQRHGDVNAPDGRKVTVPAVERFMAKVNMAGPIIRADLGPCWVWTASRNTKGYGQFNPDRTRPVGAHRWAWEYFYGPVPDGLWVLHHCDNRVCVNALGGHLFLGDALANTTDMWLKNRARPNGLRPVQPCGTNAAYVRHKKHGEKPCDECRAAHREYERTRTARRVDG